MTKLTSQLPGVLEELDSQPIPDEEPAQAPRSGAGERYLTLRMPRTVPYEEGFEFTEGNLDFGPAAKHSANHDETNIRFRADGAGDGYAIVREGHPLLPALMQRYPQVQVVESNPKPEAYVCEICEAEYKTTRGLLTHKLSHG